MIYSELLNRQREFYNTQQTKKIAFRQEQLKRLKAILQKNEDLLYEALYQDFGKSEFDTYTSEFSFIYNDIDYYVKNLVKLSQPEKVRTNLANLPGSSSIYKEPLGCCLVIGTWNYPYQLCFSPMIAAMAAGNTVIVKPSEIAPHSMKAIATLINNNFPSEYLWVIEGGISEITSVLQLCFDKIFFTGSTTIGKKIYEAAAKNLTPVTLELGGKSPAIITKNSAIKIAAKRIVWGKFLNAGQTCVAPDYILVNESKKEMLISELKYFIKKFDYHPSGQQYTQIVNDKNFNRLTELINVHQKQVIFGGNSQMEKRYISPTLLYPVSWEDEIMKTEIFGPILPIITYHDFKRAIKKVSTQKEKPLSAYLFSNSKSEIDYFINNLSFGGGCINDTVMHLSNPFLPFGGVGKSGIGNYHGKYGFDCFSHQKSIFKKKLWGEPNLKFPPYSKRKLKWIKWLLNLE